MNLSRTPGRARHFVLLFFSLLLALLIPVTTEASPVVISDVPAYNWYHGCGPTAAASVLGYWDLHGYPTLFTAEGSAVYLTANVQDQISSPAHNAKYDPVPDNPNLPEPPKTSIADWFRTSVNQAYGWSYQSDAPTAFTGYANYRGYNFTAWYQPYGTFKWSNLVAEINAGRPMMFLVDSSGTGNTDHFVPVLGYDDRGADGLWYGIFTTWGENETVEWKKFQAMSSSYSWGVGYATYIEPVSAPVPIPGAVWLLGSGLLGIVTLRRRLKK